MPTFVVADGSATYLDTAQTAAPACSTDDFPIGTNRVGNLCATSVNLVNDCRRDVVFIEDGGGDEDAVNLPNPCFTYLVVDEDDSNASFEDDEGGGIFCWILRIISFVRSFVFIVLC